MKTTTLHHKLALFLILSTLIVFPLQISDVTATTREYRAMACAGYAGKDAYHVKDSLLLSTLSLCLPGILEKTHEFKEFRCQKAVCYYESAKHGLSRTSCDINYDIQVCKYTYGEVFQFPGLRSLDFFRNKLAEFLSDPGGFLIAYGAGEARKYVQEAGTRKIQAGCADCSLTDPVTLAGAVLLVAIDIPAIRQTYKDMAENGFDIGRVNSGTNYCEQLPDIKKELKELRKAAEESGYEE